MRKGLAMILAVLAALAAETAWRATPAALMPAALGLALLLIGGYALGHLFRRLSLPQVSGYMVAGLMLGPYVLGLLSEQRLEDFSLISEFALALIALAAGGELELAALARRRRTIGLLLSTRFVLVVGGTAGMLVLCARFFPFLAALSLPQLLAAGATMGVLSYATSPSTLMAVIAELKSRGPFTSIALGTTVAIDVLVVVLFALTVSLADVAMNPGRPLDLLVVVRVLGEVGASFLLGGALAAALHGYMTRIGREVPLVILAVGFFVARLTPPLSHVLSDALSFPFHLEPLLVCLAAGFALRNFSPQGRKLIEALDSSALPVYVAFFALTGAALDVQTIGDFWPLALFVVGVRFFWLWLSGVTAGRLAGEPRHFGHWFGPALSAQAGVSLGLAEILRTRFPAMGETLAPICIAVIVINQLIGPVLLKLALTSSGEGAPVGKAR